MTPAPAGQTPGAASTCREIACAWGLSVSQISCGMVRTSRPVGNHGAPYSTSGNARISRLRLGVAPCQPRLSQT